MKICICSYFNNFQTKLNLNNYESSNEQSFWNEFQSSSVCMQETMTAETAKKKKWHQICVDVDSVQWLEECKKRKLLRLSFILILELICLQGISWSNIKKASRSFIVSMINSHFFQFLDKHHETSTARMKFFRGREEKETNEILLCRQISDLNFFSAAVILVKR